ncbi:MAG TPA: biotin/lipoyl-binding protein [Chitinophagaceae bacterium]|nr:biotin/lipoyl-binding protein [Chitinophagaceae bacterium]
MATQSTAFSVKAGAFQFTISPDDLAHADFINNGPGVYHLVKQNRSVHCVISHEENNAKKMTVEVDGQIFEVEIRDELDQMLDQLGFSSASTKHIKEIKAPMPGLVLDIAVTEGQEVLEGDRILILEAMKMENSILIHANAKIKEVKVKAGQAVEKGQVLVTLD